MAPLTHPSIRNGWFREISSQWPGQAMTLKVTKILHVEKSHYQDVLVFESATYGNVLVLDGVIQCTERDEFSYQEMLAHLPMNTHPNPENILVIGGGDGGVVREVLKHASVKKVVLCDIDEAVIRVSRQFLPHMSSLLSSEQVTVVIGDEFKYLAENKATYDVIITDSSDPVGPAKSLFEESYFQLLHGALAPGGNLSTQAECLWIHLPLIQGLKSMASAIFPAAEYAYTTIPTYPSGQIGFMVCSNAEGRDLKTPLRRVEGTTYYNDATHSAAFSLPEFGRAMLDDGQDILPKIGRAARALSNVNKPAKKVLILGVGSLDVNNAAELYAQVAAHDLVISLIPYTYHAEVIKAGIKGKTNVVTTSYISPAMRSLEEEVKAAGIVVMNEVGLDPGIDHLYAVKKIEEVHAKGGKVKQFDSYCGAMPAPECCDNPLGYKFSWSPRGGLLALMNPASFIMDNKQVDIAGKDLMRTIEPVFVSPAFAFVAYANRDSVPFREFYRIPEATTVKRSTLRYQGNPAVISALIDLGWMDTAEKTWLKEGMTWAEATQLAIGAEDSTESILVAKVRTICKFPNDNEATRIISGLKWMGLFSSERITLRGGNLLDTLCAHFEVLMKYKQGERDLIMLQHKFIVEWADGKTDTFTSTLEAYGNPIGHSAMALTVGLTCGIATQLVLDGVFNTPGVHAPYTNEICDPIREILESEGIGLVEKTL
ncbi:spermine synthase [Hymenopellis radicata]|nr:spermine synthase [Hymenopellis radicata]